MDLLDGVAMHPDTFAVVWLVSNLLSVIISSLVTMRIKGRTADAQATSSIEQSSAVLLQTVSQELARQSEKINELRARIDQKDREMEEATARILELERKLTIAESLLNIEREDNKQLRARIQTQNNEICELRDENTILTRRVNDLEARQACA